jgi:6-phosphofructokinase 1
MKTLIVVSGGDAPGINTAIGHFTAIAVENGDTVMGAYGGFPGILESGMRPLDPFTVMPWMGRAGSMLQTSREPVLKEAEAQARLRAAMFVHNIDNVLLFGGDGSLKHIPPLLLANNIPCIGIPTTIDNDVPGTEETLGFDSACNYAYSSIDGVLLTAHALKGRMFMVETLGGNSGFLALAIAHGAGAHAVVIPEYEYDLETLAQRLRTAAHHNGYALLVITEWAKGARTLVDELPSLTDIRIRDIRLGHAQRGAPPSHRDRVLAAEMARTAYHALRTGKGVGITVVREGRGVLHEGTLEGFPVPIPDRTLYNQINGLE